MLKQDRELKVNDMRMFLVALSSLMLCACAGTGTPESGAATPMPQMTNPKVFTEADSAACTEAGGLYERAGRMQWYRCTVTFDDAGKTCSDAADCQGRCMAGEGSMSDVATAV